LPAATVFVIPGVANTVVSAKTIAGSVDADRTSEIADALKFQFGDTPSERGSIGQGELEYSGDAPTEAKVRTAESRACSKLAGVLKPGG